MCLQQPHQRHGCEGNGCSVFWLLPLPTTMLPSLLSFRSPVSWALSGSVCLSAQPFPLTFAAHTAPIRRHLDTESVASPRPIVQMPSATEWTLLPVIAPWRSLRSSFRGERRSQAIQCPYSRAAADKNLILPLSWGKNRPTPWVRPMWCSANKPPSCCCTPSITVINGFSICRGSSLAPLDCCVPTRQSQLVRSLDDVQGIYTGLVYFSVSFLIRKINYFTSKCLTY